MLFMVPSSSLVQPHSNAILDYAGLQTFENMSKLEKNEKYTNFRSSHIYDKEKQVAKLYQGFGHQITICSKAFKLKEYIFSLF
jgi:hypothetical protein